MSGHGARCNRTAVVEGARLNRGAMSSANLRDSSTRLSRAPGFIYLHQIVAKNYRLILPSVKIVRCALVFHNKISTRQTASELHDQKYIIKEIFLPNFDQ